MYFEVKINTKNSDVVELQNIRGEIYLKNSQIFGIDFGH